MIWIIYAIVFAGLLIASIFDIKSNTIPVIIFPLILIPSTILNIIRIEPDKLEVILILSGGLLYGLAALFLMLRKKMGGADVWMFFCIGFSIGFVAMTETIALACLTGLIVFLIKRKKKEYPFAPMVLTGFVGHVIISLIIR